MAARGSGAMRPRGAACGLLWVMRRGSLRRMATKKTAKRAKQAASAEKSPAKTARRGRRRGGARGPRAGSKTAFILSQPLDAPAKDVVEAGAKSGHRFDVRYVYAIRSASKAKGGASSAGPASDGAAGGAPRGRGRPRGSAGGALTVSGSLESQFARMAVDIGIARAEAILRRVREQLERLTF